MLTWALCWLISKTLPDNFPIMLLLLSMGFDSVMVVSITVCWWGKFLSK